MLFDAVVAGRRKLVSSHYIPGESTTRIKVLADLTVPYLGGGGTSRLASDVRTSSRAYAKPIRKRAGRR